MLVDWLCYCFKSCRKRCLLKLNNLLNALQKICLIWLESLLCLFCACTFPLPFSQGCPMFLFRTDKRTLKNFQECCEERRQFPGYFWGFAVNIICWWFWSDVYPNSSICCEVTYWGLSKKSLSFSNTLKFLLHQVIFRVPRLFILLSWIKSCTWCI